MNPEKYTELAINAAIERTALTRGRVMALEVFRDSLRAEIQQTLPELWQAFERQRSAQQQSESRALRGCVWCQ